MSQNHFVVSGNLTNRLLLKKDTEKLNCIKLIPMVSLAMRWKSVLSMSSNKCSQLGHYSDASHLEA